MPDRDGHVATRGAGPRAAPAPQAGPPRQPARAATALAAGAFAGFIVLLTALVAGWPPLRAVDAAGSAWFRAYGTQHPAVISVLRVLTDVMATGAFVGLGLAAAALLAARGRRRPAGFCLAATAVTPLAWGLQHWAVHRPRPSAGFVAVSSNGFPSGHTTNATVAAAVAVVLLWPRLRPAGRVTAVAGGVAFAGGIGLTRVALLAHWPVDLLGGWLLGITLVAALAAVSAPTPGPGWPPAPGCAGRASPGSG